MSSILAAMLNGGIVGAVVAAAVWAGLRVPSRRVLNASARYLVWWAALAAVLMLPLAYLRVSPRAGAGGTVDRAEKLAPRTGAGEPAAPQVHDPAVSMQAASPSQVTVKGPLFPLVLPPGAGSEWILTVWAALSAILLVRLAASCILLERRKMRAMDAPPHLASRIDAWLSQRGARRREARLVCSAEIGSPMLGGLRRPAILIPDRLIAELEEGELDQIGLHEAAHLARRDDYALLVQRTIEALFPLHPVVRWITRQIDLEREIACDDLVVETMGLPRSYAKCLTRMVELCNGVRESWGGTPAAGAGSHLTRRVDRLLDRNRQDGVRPGTVRPAMAIGIVAGLAFLAARTPGVIAFAMPAVASVEASALAPVTEPAQDPQPPAEARASAASAASKPTETPYLPLQTAATASTSTKVVAVTVHEPSNRYVTGLGRENFKVLEDGIEREISAFSSGNVPISVGIVVDTSGSMRDRLDQARLVVSQFLEAVGPQDEFFLIRFNASAELAAGFTNEAGQIQNQMNLLQAGRGPALREGIDRALQEMKNAKNPRRVLLVISEAQDNSSRFTQEELRNAARDTNVQIYALPVTVVGGLSYAPVPAFRWAVHPGGGRAFLRELAEKSGGQEYIVDDAATQPGAAVNTAIRSVYVLGYQSTNTAEHPTLRVETVVPKGMPPLRANVRTGNYALSQ